MDSKEEILERHMGFSYYHSHAYIRGDVFNAMDEYTLSIRKELEEAKAKKAKGEDASGLGRQASLFEAPFESLPLRAAVDFYRHDKGWANRLIAGDSLRARLKRGTLSDQEIVEVFGPLLSAVRAAHEIGVVHRDLKPDNVMLVAGSSGTAASVKLLDFGIAKIRDEQPGVVQLHAALDTKDGLATAAGAIMGTPAYMAPEQIKNSSGVDKRADIYAIGIMLYEALAGRRPFEAESSAELMGAHMYMKADPPSKQVQKHQVPDRQLDWAKLDPVVMRALAKKPDERYQDCAALQADLEAAWGQSFSIARGTALTAGSSVTIAALPAAVAKPKSKGPLVAGLVAGLVLLGGGAAVVLSRGGSQGVAQAQQAEATALVGRAQTGSPVDRRALQEIIKAVGGRTHLPLVAKALTDEDPSVARAALQAVMALAHPGDESLSEPLQQLAGQAVGAMSVEVAAAQLRIGVQGRQQYYADADADAGVFGVG